MRKVLLFAGFVAGLVAINARIDATRQCYCQYDCWCQKPGLRHFHWVLPVGHKDMSAEWKQEMESSSPT